VERTDPIDRPKRKRNQPMLPRVSAVPPYEWVPSALATFASDEAVSRSEACCRLLDQAIERGLEYVRVLQTFPAGRGSAAKNVKADEHIPTTAVPLDRLGLFEALEGALLTLRTQHIARAQQAWKVLAQSGLSKGLVDVRGWRTQIEGSKSASVVMQLETDAKLPADALRDACDCVTGGMVMADVLRALWASELEIVGYAPKGWSDRHRVNIGWLRFDRQIVR
jgi:hypothetical protein